MIVLNKGRGKFVYAYNESAYILSYLCGYKILDGLRCGFPDNALDKILQIIEDNKISYKVISPDAEVILISENENNTYEEILNISKEHLEKEKIIELINNRVKKMDINDLTLLLSQLLVK